MSSGPIKLVQTPTFGVCGSSLNHRCVLSEESCDETEVYSAPYETDMIPGLNSCQDPNEVVIGRCQGYSCAPSEESCVGLWNKNDSTCSLVTDNGVDRTAYNDMHMDDEFEDDDGISGSTDEGSTPNKTIFPACANLDEGEWQCVLDESSCRGNEELQHSKDVERFGPNSCHCEDVPTGICYQTGSAEEPLTPKNSFCALSDRDCPSTHKFMTDRDVLTTSYLVTYDCRLCAGSDGVASYGAGACLNSGASQTDADFRASSFEYCAFESTECSSGVDGFVSAKRLEQQGLFCPVERTTNWGICSNGDDPFVCTNKPSSCLYSFTSLETPEKECDINRNSKTGVPTYFSSCNPKSAINPLGTDNVRCVWGEWECDPFEEMWEEARLPNDPGFTGCTCEDVFTGVCLEPSNGEYHCAVSPEGCTAPETYVKQLDLKDQGIDLVCQMCAPKGPPTIPPYDPVPQEPLVPSPTAPPITPLVNTPIDQPVTFEEPPTFKPTEAPRPTLPPALNVGGTGAPIPSPTFSPIVNGPEPTVAPIPWPTLSSVDGPVSTPSWPTNAPVPTPFWPTNAPELALESDTLPTNALILIAVGPVLVIALIVLLYAILTRGGTLKKSKGTTHGVEPNPDHEMVVPDATLT